MKLNLTAGVLLLPENEWAPSAVPGGCPDPANPNPCTSALDLFFIKINPSSPEFSVGDAAFTLNSPTLRGQLGFLGVTAGGQQLRSDPLGQHQAGAHRRLDQGRRHDRQQRGAARRRAPPRTVVPHPGPCDDQPAEPQAGRGAEDRRHAERCPGGLGHGRHQLGSAPSRCADDHPEHRFRRPLQQLQSGAQPVRSGHRRRSDDGARGQRRQLHRFGDRRAAAQRHRRFLVRRAVAPRARRR